MKEFTTEHTESTEFFWWEPLDHKIHGLHVDPSRRALTRSLFNAPQLAQSLAPQAPWRPALYLRVHGFLRGAKKTGGTPL